MSLETLTGLAYEQYRLQQRRAFNAKVAAVAEAELRRLLAQQYGVRADGPIDVEQVMRPRIREIITVLPHGQWKWSRPETSTKQNIQELAQLWALLESYNICRQLVYKYRDRGLLLDVDLRAQIFGTQGERLQMSNRDKKRLLSQNPSLVRYWEHLFELLSARKYPRTGIQGGSLQMLLRDDFFAFPDPAGVGLDEGKAMFAAIQDAATKITDMRMTEMERRLETTTRENAYLGDPYMFFKPTKVYAGDPYLAFEVDQVFWDKAESVESGYEQRIQSRGNNVISRIKNLLRKEPGAARFHDSEDPARVSVMDMLAASLFQSIALDPYVREVVQRSKNMKDIAKAVQETGDELLLAKHLMRLLQSGTATDPNVEEYFRQLYGPEYGDFFAYTYKYDTPTGWREAKCNLLDDFLRGHDFGINQFGQIDEAATEDLRKAQAIREIVEKNIGQYPPIYQMELRFTLSLISDAEAGFSYSEATAISGLDPEKVEQPGRLRAEARREAINNSGRVRRLYADLIQTSRRMVMELYINDRTARLQDAYEQAFLASEEEYDKKMEEHMRRLGLGEKTEKPDKDAIFYRKIEESIESSVTQYRLQRDIRTAVGELFYGKDKTGKPIPLKLSADPQYRDSARLATIARDFMKRGFLADRAKERNDTALIVSILRLASQLKEMPEFAEYVRLLDPRHRVFKGAPIVGGKVRSNFWSLGDETARSQAQLGTLLSSAEDILKQGIDPTKKEDLEKLKKHLKAKTELMRSEIKVDGVSQLGINRIISVIIRNQNMKRMAFRQKHLIIPEDAAFYELDPIAQGMVSATIDVAIRESYAIDEDEARKSKSAEDLDTELKKMDYMTELYENYRASKDRAYRDELEKRRSKPGRAYVHRAYEYNGTHVIDWAIENAKSFYNKVFPGYEAPDIDATSYATDGRIDSLVNALLTFAYDKEKFEYTYDYVTRTSSGSMKYIDGAIKATPKTRDDILNYTFRYFNKRIPALGRDEFNSLLPNVQEYMIQYFNEWRSFLRGMEERMPPAAQKAAAQGVSVAKAIPGMWAAMLAMNAADNAETPRRGFFAALAGFRSKKAEEKTVVAMPPEQPEGAMREEDTPKETEPEQARKPEGEKLDEKQTETSQILDRDQASPAGQGEEGFERAIFGPSAAQPLDKVITTACIDYVQSNKGFLRDFLKQTDEQLLIRVPIESLEGLSVADIYNWLGVLNRVPTLFIELYSAQNPEKAVDEAVYDRYGLSEAINKRLSFEQETGKRLSALRTNKNTITLVLPKDEWSQANLLRFDLQTQEHLKNTMLVPIIQKNDPSGLIRSSILGLRLVQIARTPDISSEFIEQTYDQYTLLLRTHGTTNITLTIDDIRSLASTDFNELFKALKRLIESLPKPTPISPNDIKNIYERARSILEAA